MMANYLGLPEPPFDLGMEEVKLRVRADLDLEIVELTLPGKFEIALSQTATIDLVLRLVGALGQLNQEEPSWIADLRRE